MNKWSELPSEIQENIIKYVQPTGQTHVCRLWNSLAQKYMYRSVYFENMSTMVNFIRCNVKSNIGQWVQYLVINESVFDFLNRNAEETKTLMYTLSWLCPNVIRLSSGDAQNNYQLANEGKLRLHPIVYDMPLNKHRMESYIRFMSKFEHLQQFILSDRMSVGFLHSMIAALGRFSQLKVVYLVRTSLREDVPKMLSKFSFLKRVNIKEVFLIGGKLLSPEAASDILNKPKCPQRNPKIQGPMDDGGWDNTSKSWVVFDRNRFSLVKYNSHGENHQNDILQTFVYSYA